MALFCGLSREQIEVVIHDNAKIEQVVCAGIITVVSHPGAPESNPYFVGPALIEPPIHREIEQQKQNINRLADRMNAAQATRLDRMRQQLDAADRLRETLSYKATLQRGYAVVRAEGEVLTTKKQASKHSAFEIEFADGLLNTGQPTTSPAAPKKSAKKDAPDQGSLF